MEIFYKLFVIAVALAGIWSGYRRGILKQLMSLLGVAFGVVASRLLTPSVAEWMYEHIPVWHDKFACDIVYSVYASALIFAVVYFCFAVASVVVNKIVGSLEIGAFDMLLGVIFRLFRNLLFVSIIFNMIAVCSPDSKLVEAQNATDGNLIEAVMPIAPILLDNGYGDFEHRLKLEEAKTIS